MYLITEKKILTPKVTQMKIFAPLIVKHAKPGQFVMIRTSEKSERIPLTIAEVDEKNQTIAIIFQVVGASTYELDQLNTNDFILDCAGPLGKPSELEGIRRVILVGGGVGCAILYPIAKALKKEHVEILTIIGFKNKSYVFLDDEFLDLSNRLILTTDDGSMGEKGFVTTHLKSILNEDASFDRVITIGPLPMMKLVSEITRPYHLKTIVSMNPIMVDGTGMCGGCRIEVDKKMKFACVDGPEFDGHLVNFDLAIKRNQMYLKEESDKLAHLLKDVNP